MNKNKENIRDYFGAKFPKGAAVAGLFMTFDCARHLIVNPKTASIIQFCLALYITAVLIDSAISKNKAPKQR